MKKTTFFVLLFVGSILISRAQQIENLRIKSLNDKINLIYDIAHEKTGQLFNVKIACSDDGGINFNLPLKSITGDYGTNVEGGTDKVIVWDVLLDKKELKGSNFVFKLTAEPISIKKQTDNIQAFNLELIDCYKKDQNIVCAVKITNNGTKRDLKLINRLARIYDFNGKTYEARSSKLGKINGNDKYSAPTLTFLPEQSNIAIFNFNINNGFSNRIKLLDIGVEILDITYGLDLKTGNLQFKDISLENPESPAKTELVSEIMSLNISPEIKKIKDVKPPVVIVTNPKLEKNNTLKVNTESIVINGKITDENGVFELTINGMGAKLEADGTFESEAYLAEGNNTIFVRAVDVFQNSTEETYSIYYQALNKEGQRQSSNNKNLTDPSMLDKEDTKKAGYYALLIGVSEYPDPDIAELDQPTIDAEKLYNTLTTMYSFDKEHTILLKNPKREDIINELDKLNRVITKNDNLLVFYAGHGHWDEQDEMGYWLPSDAKKANTANWIRNSTIRDYLKAIDSKHTLLIADACFSGGIFKTRKAFTDAPKSIQKLYEYPSRKAMTSGTLKEVPDKSVFLLYLNKRLTENTQDYISAEELFSSFKIAVLNNSPNIPQYGEIKDTGDEGGDFIFIKKKE